MNCERARQTTHRILDRDLMDAGVQQEHSRHLEGCGACRRHAAELSQVQQALSALPAVAMSDRALREVRRRTTEAPARRARRRWPWAAAAALGGVALLGGWLWLQRPDTGPTPEELARAANETRMALSLASQALRTTKQVGIRGVLSDEVAPALRRLPLEWPEKPSAERRKKKDDV